MTIYPLSLWEDHPKFKETRELVSAQLSKSPAKFVIDFTSETSPMIIPACTCKEKSLLMLITTEEGYSYKCLDCKTHTNFVDERQKAGSEWNALIHSK